MVIPIHSVKWDILVVSDHWANAFWCWYWCLTVGDFQRVGTNHLMKSTTAKASLKQRPNWRHAERGLADQQGIARIPADLAWEVSFPSLDFCETPFRNDCPTTSSSLVGNTAFQWHHSGRRCRREGKFESWFLPLLQMLFRQDWQCECWKRQQQHQQMRWS